MTQEQKWLSYVAQLREKHEIELRLLREVTVAVSMKLKDKDLDIQKLKGENEQLQEQISTLQGQFIDQDLEMQTAVNLLQNWVHNEHGPLNETINFVQAYWNKHNIFPYEP